MAAFMILFENERALRRKRVFRDREHPLDKFSDTELISRYRFPRHTIIELTDLIKDRVQHPTARSHAIPPHLQVSFYNFSNSMNRRAKVVSDFILL